MAQFAPTSPSTAELHRLYPSNEITQLNIEVGRQRVGGILSGEEPGLVGAVGGCAMTHDVDTIRREGADQQELTQTEEGLWIVQRRPPWKPRTNRADWHGMETDDPEGKGAHYAYRTLAGEATWGAGVAIELSWLDEAHRETHADRYGDLLTLGWIGGRNVHNAELMQRVAMRDPSLPLLVKNGLDGNIDTALQQVERLTEMRGSGAAPVALLYRGGENAKDRGAWEREYRTALEVTGGRMVVDVAHGTEMAHDPEGNFKKTVKGQEDALEHVIEIAERHEEIPAGVMAEASDAETRTDPHMRHAIALNGLVRVNDKRRSRVLAGSPSA